MRNLIRNGGFERGTIDFWTGYDTTSFAVSTTTPYKGTYCGLLTSNGVSDPYVMCTDFISVAEGEEFVFEGFFRKSSGAGATSASIYVVYYDEGLDEITTEYYDTVNLHDTTYDPITLVISGHQASCYMKVKIVFETSSITEGLLLDNLSLSRIDIRKVAGVTKTMMDRISYNSFGIHYSELFIAALYKEGVFSMRCTGITPATGRLDLIVQTWDRASRIWVDIATFTQISAAITEQVLIVTAGLGEIIRVKEEISGATSIISYKLLGMLKR